MTGRFIGWIGPWCPEGWPGTEIGWTIARDRWGQGLATEGETAAARWAFDRLGWTEMIHVIAPDNPASQAVARKLGSSNRGAGRLPAPLENARVEILGQTLEEWRQRGGWPMTAIRECNERSARAATCQERSLQIPEPSTALLREVIRLGTPEDSMFEFSRRRSPSTGMWG